MIAKQDRHGVRTASDLVRRYKFRKKFSETLGVATDARKEAEQAMAETIELSDNISLKATHDIPGKKTIIDLLVDNKKYSGEIDMSDFYTKEEVDEMVGDITIALDHIIELQFGFIDGSYGNITAALDNIIDIQEKLIGGGESA